MSSIEEIYTKWGTIYRKAQRAIENMDHDDPRRKAMEVNLQTILSILRDLEEIQRSLNTAECQRSNNARGSKREAE